MYIPHILQNQKSFLKLLWNYLVSVRKVDQLSLTRGVGVKALIVNTPCPPKIGGITVSYNLTDTLHLGKILCLKSVICKTFILSLLLLAFINYNASSQNLDAGYRHGIVLKPDGSVACWGYNNSGQCNVPAPNSGFIAISGGGYHTMGLKPGGSVVCWGNNNFGQCNVPAPNSGFVAISGGVYFSAGLKSDGSVVCWGINESGQRDVPAPNSGFIAVSAGFHHTMGLKSDGSVVCWGYNDFGQCNVPAPNSGFVAISADDYHSMGLKSDGSIVCWGSNTRGQCNVPAPNSGFVSIAAGDFFSIGLKSDGSVVCWGDNTYGQCNIPAPNSAFIAIAAGEDFSIGLKSDGSVVCWGGNAQGQCNGPVPNSGFIIAPGSPTVLAVSSLTSTSFTAKWSPSYNVTGYRLDVSTHADFSSCDILNNQTITGYSVTNYPVTGLTAATNYYYRLRAVNGLGTSLSSVIINVTTPKYDQSIIFNELPLKTYGDAPFTVTATGGGSGNPVTFTSSDNTIASCTGTNGSTITILKAGSCTIYADQAGNATYNDAPQAGQVLTINPKTITVGSITPAGKVYDGNTSMAITGGTLSGVVSGDNVSLGLGTVSFTDKNAGVGKSLTAAGFTISGTAAGNYALIQPTGLTADITSATLAIGITAQDKTYDGNTNASVLASITGGRVTGDNVTVSASNGSFDNKNAGNGKTVTAGINLSGADAGNYTAAATANTNANITPATLTIGITAQNKTYDGNTNASASASITGGRVTGDNVTVSAGNGSFDNKNVGSGKTVTAGINLSGADAGNYTAAAANTTANITPAALTVNITAQNKPYDGNANASVAASITSGLITGDDVTANASNGLFDNANVGSNKPVTANINISGTDAGNYTCNATGATTASILDITSPMATFPNLATTPVRFNTSIEIAFSEPVNIVSATLQEALILREGGINGTDLSFTPAGYSANNLLQFTINAGFKCGASYYLAVKAGSFADASGNAVELAEKTFSTDPAVDKPIIAADNGKTTLCPGDYLSISNYSNNLSYQWQLAGIGIAGQTGSQFQVPAGGNGNYTVYSRNSTTGCENTSDSYTAQIYNVLTPVVYEKNDEGLLSLLIVDNTASTFATYLWTYADGSSLPAEIVSNRQFLTLTGANLNGQYRVQVTDNNGCQTLSGIALATADIAAVKIYPTINNGTFKVDFVHPDNGRVSVNILNQTGVVVKQCWFNKSSKEITFEVNMNAATMGQYMVEISMDSYRAVKGIVFE